MSGKDLADGARLEQQKEKCASCKQEFDFGSLNNDGLCCQCDLRLFQLEVINDFKSK